MARETEVVGYQSQHVALVKDGGKDLVVNIATNARHPRVGEKIKIDERAVGMIAVGLPPRRQPVAK